MDEGKVYRAALEKWGADAQTLMAFEEMAELQKELCKAARGKDNTGEIAEEIADVEIMLGQMKILHDCVGISAGYKRRKLERLVERLGETGLNMAFKAGRVCMKGEDPVQLGPGVSFRLEKTSVSTPRSLPDGVPVEVVGRLKNLCEFCKEMSGRGGVWAQREWGVDAAALEFAVAILSELEEMKEVHVKETPGQGAELWKMLQEAGPGMIVNLQPETEPCAYTRETPEWIKNPERAARISAEQLAQVLNSKAQTAQEAAQNAPSAAAGKDNAQGKD